MEKVFDREKHTYKSDAFEELIKDTVRFFNGTPWADKCTGQSSAIDRVEAKVTEYFTPENKENAE